DFTVASDESLTGRLLGMRRQAFAALGDRRLADGRIAGRAPAVTVTDVREGGQDPGRGRRVTGTVSVPCFLDRPGCPTGARFPRVGPRARGTLEARFVCTIPRAALAEGAPPATPVLYGHGLLGSADEVDSGALRRAAEEQGFVICGADWIGMAREDLPTVQAILADLSRFPALADRLQQGQLDFLLLGRAMAHPAGLAAEPAFRRPDGSPVLGGDLGFSGNSQGGILGGALTAVAPDFRRAALGVPAINYSTLLPRSVDFEPFSGLLARSYPRPADRPLALSLVQILWDRGEGDGYAHRMTARPPPDTPPHQVLLIEAFGDHQVANAATEVLARSIGAGVRTPALDPGRSLDRVPFAGIPRLRSGPLSGNVLLPFDVGPVRDDGTGGTPPPPVTPTPPSVGQDPHGLLGLSPVPPAVVASYLRTGTVPDPCAGRPCYAAGWTGP
ncbi:MAG TPA: hypothetical protein VK279_00840, partial [Solirubrobacteraceae bacterium]|nr:hypothetical protein [Solirubrobacteraceae bacterium]